MGFDSSFDSERAFFKDLLPKIFEKKVSWKQLLWRPIEPGLVTPTRMPSQTVDGF